MLKSRIAVKGSAKERLGSNAETVVVDERVCVDERGAKKERGT